MIPLLKMAISILLTMPIFCAQLVACPKEHCAGYSLPSKTNCSQDTPAICNTNTTCPHHVKCFP
ncbi:hypothetical protein PGT21_026920 [Puccinia graminis f. sp. tritici]|uniref:Uncharacterized protein n=1 Tax=Puccinia graminis f. sp. tritici TaxID=56615 RepID=A0A5B0NLL8_PUCGR|nr:hypothetical protein PGT21_026920 [Puccinia graminis f. sp. tritici]